MPRVSILVPLYNTKIKYLREMIESVRRQTFADFELLLLNDSPLNKEIDCVVGEYVLRDARIKYERNDRNIGISKSRNKLLSMARGEYIAVLDHDDICLPERLEKQVMFLDENIDIGVVGSWVEKSNNGRVLKFPESNIDIKRTMMRECAISHSAAMIRKSILEKNNIRWNESYSPSEDYMLWADLMGCTMFHNLQQVLLVWRIYSESSGAQKGEKMADAAMRVRSILANRYPSFARCSRWLYLFGCIPFLKIYERGYQDVRYLLFGKIPLARMR